MLSQQSKDIIAATLPVVREHAATITAVFYPLMFERYPEVKGFFNEAHQGQGTQPQALANAVVAYAANLDRLEVLGDAVSLIVQKHVSLNIQPAHYPIVGECLLAAIRAVLGEAASDAVLGAWGEAYGQLADILIGAEEQRYQQNEQKTGGWRGERSFTVQRKERESDVITSFYLVPSDGGPLAEFVPGQFTCLVVDIGGRSVRRNYSLSDRPGLGHYRISVKREAEGEVSSFLHDRIQVGDELRLTAPSGSFMLNQQQRPLVLLTGGVGITPAISMLQPALESGRQVHFLHGALNSSTHAFREHVDALAQQHDNLSISYVYSHPLAGDQPHDTGFFDQQKLSAMLPDGPDVDVYFLGPKPFMQNCQKLLNALGIPAENQRYEFFGPLEELSA
ncbi:NO-inducible flavohemoprotein [Halopseudomonas sp. SMJS2]|uniref:NO-inducible flavohemoprotein n=1 Tax=Halopseudomonas sp. SMJS2 TaxID=3041098 RepID=UPI002452BD61|nr:NO-inducible flavohemoprotein [Halopseudomonas sp. SMJS2]WGK60390.1 NO-inducible flavohemoprotein [Halopseudomonas sp. SMJS2]